MTFRAPAPPQWQFSPQSPKIDSSHILQQEQAAMDYAAKWNEGLSYEAFLDKYATDEQRTKWNRFDESVSLSIEQSQLLSSFTREMKVLVLAGAWCGDCVNQCPIFKHFAAATEKIQLRFFDRDDQADLAEQLQTCGGARVPAVLFLSEDDTVCGRYGDRTLAKYRDMAASLVGAACDSGLVTKDNPLTAEVVQEWLDQFERIQLMLRTSSRLRKLHND